MGSRTTVDPRENALTSRRLLVFLRRRPTAGLMCQCLVVELDEGKNSRIVCYFLVTMTFVTFPDIVDFALKLVKESSFHIASVSSHANSFQRHEMATVDAISAEAIGLVIRHIRRGMVKLQLVMALQKRHEVR